MASASVTVHYTAIDDDDRRFAFLAKLLGVTVDDASFKMVRLWSVMTKLQTDVPPAESVRACLLDERGEELLVRCGLGERLEDGAVRVCGRHDNTTGKDRFEWWSAPEQRVRGGQTRAATGVRDTKGRFQNGDLSSSSSYQDPKRESPDLDPPSPELPDPRTIVSAERGAASRDDIRRKLWGEIWQLGADEYQKLKFEGIDPDARSCWGGTPILAETKPLGDLIAQLIAGDPPDEAGAREKLRNRVFVAAAEARFKHKHLRFMTPARLWNAESFAIAAAMSPKQVEEEAKARASPRNGAPRETPTEKPRPIKTL